MRKAHMEKASGRVGEWTSGRGDNLIHSPTHLLRIAVHALFVVLLIHAPLSVHAQKITIGSKPFTESYVLAEIAKKLLQDAGFNVEHRQGMSSNIVWEALKGSNVTIYPDYTGTIKEVILKVRGDITADEMRTALAEYSVGMTKGLGFNNTYAITVPRKLSEQLNLRKISALRNHPDLKVGVDHSFLNRPDGWGAMVAHYGLKMNDVRGVEHALGYSAILKGEIDLMNAYSTDAKLAEYDLAVLEDDLNFFPKYDAVFLYRLNIDPQAQDVLRRLEGTFDETLMTRLNAKAEETGDYTVAAALYFSEREGKAVEVHTESFASKLVRWTGRHLLLVCISMFIAIVISIPLGIRASPPGLISQLILGVTGMIQTIPALALLALLVPLPMLGISPTTAIVALFLYSLLPIVRNTATGLQEIPTPLRESAAALGLEPLAQLTKVYLPMASRTILAGIKTSAIINVGTATLAALIGAGGLGEPIISGLALNDSKIILQGAIPAAMLAILVQVCFDGLDRLIIPKGLRLEEASKKVAAGS